MDICLRSSLPMLLFALTFLAPPLIMITSKGNQQTSPGFFGRGANSTTSAIDFAANDLLLGSQDSIFWYLIPLCGLLSAGVSVLIHYAALSMTYIFYILCGLLPSKEIVTRTIDSRYSIVL